MLRIRELFILLICILLLSGCKKYSYDKNEYLEDTDLNASVDYEKIDKLGNLSVIMEKQMPQIKYGEMNERLLDFYTEPLKEEYEFYGRFSNLGYSYILGISKSDSNPLAQLDRGPERIEFPEMDMNENYVRLGKWTKEQQFESIYDFPGVNTFFMSANAEVIYLGIEQPDNADLGTVFKQAMNEEAQEYLEVLNEKGAQLLPPVEGTFIQVRSWEKGKYHCVYLPITQDVFDKITEDKVKISEYEIGMLGIELYTSIDTWNEGERRIDYINQCLKW